MKRLILIIILTSFFAGCKENPVPKPRGYFRIDLPEKTYRNQITDCPFQFEIPGYSNYEKRTDKNDECWFNLNFPKYRAQVHFTYKPVNDNLRQLLEESHSMSFEHHVKANDIKRSAIQIDSTCVYGLVFRLDGDVASSIQLYLTDSVNHFLRGSLYFNVKTNSDSLAPVVEFIAEDMINMANTLRWNNSACGR
jgi:gliding motility-associated lipoprotein GldD